MTVTLSLYGSLLLNVVVGVCLPAVVALVTKQVAHPGVKALALMFLSAVYGLLSGWLAVGAGHPFDLGTAANTALVGFVAAVVAHFGALSPMAVTGRNGVIQEKVPGGIG